MRTVMDDLKLEKLWVIHPAKARYPLTEKIEVIGLRDFIDQARQSDTPGRLP
jgi:hypothetical protein